MDQELSTGEIWLQDFAEIHPALVYLISFAGTGFLAVTCMSVHACLTRLSAKRIYIDPDLEDPSDEPAPITPLSPNSEDAGFVRKQTSDGRTSDRAGVVANPWMLTNITSAPPEVPELPAGEDNGVVAKQKSEPWLVSNANSGHLA